MSRILHAIETHAATRPDAVALSYTTLAISYADLPAEVAHAADCLAARLEALSPGGPVAIAMDNAPAWAVLDLALMRLERPCLPLPPFFTPAQRRHAIEDAGAVLVLSEGPAGSEPDFRVAGRGVTCVPTGLPPRPLPAGTAKITYTSGSTGAPKGVCLSVAQMEAVAQSLVDRLAAEHGGVHLSLLPLGVLLENIGGLYATLIGGGTHRAPGAVATGLDQPFRPDVVRTVQAIVESRATTLILVPDLLRGVMAAMARTGVRAPDLRFVAVGGAKVAPALLETAAALGLPVYEGYGLTECASVVALNTPSDHRKGAVGRVLPHLEVSLDPDGEVVVGPRPFLGYVGGPAQAGPVRTGDLGEWDDDGFLRIVGRRDNLIINGYGRNISPEWVESELLAEPGIVQAAVFGGGGALSALLVGAPGELGASLDRANGRLPEYARVGRWLAVPPFSPAQGQLTGNGRPRRAALQAAYRDFLNCDSEA